MANQQKSELDDALVAAETALERAYAPYSKFKMGAAVITDEGNIVSGSLVENVSLGLAMCSERVAMFASISGKAGRPKILVLRSPTTDGSLTWPCGACLQVARELGGPDVQVVVSDGDRIEKAYLSELAPRLPAKS